MTKIAYIDWSPKPETMRLVDRANEIIAEYEADDYDLTLRQLYYQFVSRDLLENKQQEYKRLGSIISQARRAGLISWDAIVDRTRNLKRFSSWESPQDIIESCASSYRVDPWANQDWRVEVWFEKEALSGVFERACDEYRIPYFACRGNVSDSEMWSAARRLKRSNKDVLILHFGDHDPSGMDMTRDITDKLELLRAGGRVEVRRIALNMDQIEEHQPPPNPAKETDSRFKKYQEMYGDESWELDALDPRTLSEMVQREVESVVDMDEWQAALALEESGRRDLDTIVERYPAIIEGLRTGVVSPTPSRRGTATKADVVEAIEDGWLSFVYQSGADVLSRELGYDGDVLVVRAPDDLGGHASQRRFDTWEQVLEEIGGEVWPCLEAYRRRDPWDFSDVCLAVMQTAGKSPR